MADSEFLTPTEVKTLAGDKSARPDQLEALKALGIPHRLVGQRILVSRYHVREWLAGRVVTPARGLRMDLVR